MKRMLLMLAALLLLSACAAGQTSAPAVTPPTLTEEAKAGAPEELWTRGDLPAAVRYDRMWFISASAESGDAQRIATLVSAIRALELGGESGASTEDFTDVLTFTFADGSAVRLEFEGENAVMPDGSRRVVRGLPRLRELLDALLEAA